MKPRVMHRGLDGLPDIPDGDVPGEFDHLVFVVHGIGSACDMRFQSVVGATNTVRDMVNEMSDRHFSYAHMAGKASRSAIIFGRGKKPRLIADFFFHPTFPGIRK